MMKSAKRPDTQDADEQIDWAAKLQMLAETLHDASTELTAMVDHLRAMNREAGEKK